MSIGILGGSKYHWVMSRDSNGYPMGSNVTPNTVSTDTLYTPLVRDCGFISKDQASTEPSIITWREGNEICGKLDLGVSDVSEFNTEFASKSFEYDDFCAGVTETSPLSGVEHGGLNTGETLLPDLMAGYGVYHRTATATQYFTSTYHNVQIRPTDVSMSQSDGENPNNLTYSVTPNRTTRLITGDLVGSTYEHYRYVSHWASTLGWMFTETFIGDNTATTTTLTYVPRSTDNTGAATIRITADGSTQSVTSVSDSTGLVTFSSAPADGAIVVITYPTLFVPTS